tara:strand:- start:6860 stop:7072 length:213 start_codon:yes stop_codon:yes gene_type:complete
MENVMSKKIDFEQSLQDDDYGLIIGKNGDLKGMFVPDIADEENDHIPEAIIRILEKVYGITIPEAEVTLH